MRKHLTGLFQLAVCLALLTACDGGTEKAMQSSADDEAAAAMAEQTTVPAVFRKNADLAACLADASAEPDSAIAP